MPGMIPDDLTNALTNGTSTPTRKYPSDSRKQTILSLVEALLKAETNDATEIGLTDQPNFEDDRDVPTVDERHQVTGAESFNRFQRRISNLDKELRNFANATRQLGSSVGILSTAFRLRERLAQILFLFRENASDLFPRKVQKKSRDVVIDRRFSEVRRRRKTGASHVARPVVDEDLDVEQFPSELDALANDVGAFLECLNEFPEFTDEAVQASITSFQGDLRYWANCLDEYHGQFRYPAVQRYIHDLATEMGEHIDSITSTLSMFIEIGVPTIRFAQKHGANSLLNLSTVATFFSAVTATTMQFSYGLPRNGASDAVNVFWFSSLVFSIAAAVNSLLGLTWKQAMYRSPGNRVPWWVLIWMKRSPLVFLVMSVACFSVGLCCFSYASSQSPVTSVITTVLTSITSFGLIAVSTWFASERWVYLHHRGQKWLGDVLSEFESELAQVPGVRLTQRGFSAVASSIQSSSKFIVSSVPWCSGCSCRRDGMDQDFDIENGSSSILPTTNPNFSEPTSPLSPFRALSPFKARSSEQAIYEHSEPKEQIESPTSATPMMGNEPLATMTAASPPSRGKQLWINALRTVKMHTSVMSPLGPAVRSPRRQRTTSSSLQTPLGERKRTQGDPTEGPTVLRSRVAGLVPRLKSLQTTHDLAAHSALVRHLQFSPNGKFLATSSWDRTSVIFSVGKEFTSHRVLAHAKGFVGQVAWSPDGELLLTKLNRGMKVWTKDGVCQKTIDRGRAVESVSWFPGGKAFISVEGSEVVKLGLSGKILGTYELERMKLHDVAVTIDGERLLGVGPLLESQNGLQPSKSRVEKRLVVYNMETRQYENQTPVLNDVRDITLARNGQVALVSYENKAPPQLWKLEMLRDRDNMAQMTMRLTLRHSYMPKATVDFAGPSYFGGKNDELVLCAGKAGDIHIWDQESGALLHHVRAQALGGDLTCIAWNHAMDDPFMFATGCHDGAVRIWSKPPDPEDDPGEKVDGGSINRYQTSSPVSFTESPIIEHAELDSAESVSQPDRDRTITFATNSHTDS